MRRTYNRRSFLRQSALTAGGFLAGSALMKGHSLFSPAEKLKVGVIGTGDRGTGLINLMNGIGSFDIRAVADPLPFRLEKALKQAPGAKGYENHTQLLEHKDLDAVLIATPFSTHDEVAIAAMEAGLHIYCEKTMVKGIREIQQVLEKAAGTDRIFQTGHQYHSSLLYRKVREIIQYGYIGEITAFHCQWNRNGDWRRPVPDPRYERMINWRMYREYSGGLVAELMSHQIDFINWVTESHPAKFSGFGGIDHWKDGRETYDNIHLLMEYPSGLDASFSCTTTNGFEDYQIRVLGSKGTIILSYDHAEIYAENLQDKEKGIVDGVSGATIKAWEQGKGVPIKAPGNDPTLDALQQFYDSVRHQKPVISDIQTGATTAKCVQIALDAVHQGEVKYWKDYPELNFG